LTTQLTPDEIKNLTDDEWEAYLRSIGRVNDKIDLVRSTLDAIDEKLLGTDVVDVYDLQLLQDRVNLLITTALDAGIVEDFDHTTVTYDGWKAMNWPVYGVQEPVPSAAEIDWELDNAYDAGVDDAWDDAYTTGELDGIDVGIAITGRVLRVLNAQLVDASALRQPGATDL
jgi:hypothetical protein